MVKCLVRHGGVEQSICLRFVLLVGIMRFSNHIDVQFV